MISVIIPTLNERDNLSMLLDDLSSQCAAHEIIVADGGSVDGTQHVAKSRALRLVESDTGRGQQLAAGVAAARGENILFLHADSRFPKQGLSEISRRLAADTQLIGGNFRLSFFSEHREHDRFSHWITDFYEFIRRFGLYYGDSGIFIRRRVLDDIGGIQPLAMMEDFNLIRRMGKARGHTCYIDNFVLKTSSRRFEGRSFLDIFSGWLMMHFLYAVGASGETLARFYDSERVSEQPLSESSTYF